MEAMDTFNNFMRDIEDLELLDNFLLDPFTIRQKCAIPKSTSATSLTKIRRKRFNPLLESNDQDFKEKYRYSKENMMKLIEVIRDDLELERPPGIRAATSNQVPIEMQVLVAIRQWGSNELPELVADVHDITTHTLDKICRRVAAAFASKSSSYIRMPATLAEKEQVTKNFNAIAAFPQVIGAVACQALRLQKVIKSEQMLPIDAVTQCECFMNIQIISDASFKIRDFDYRLRPLSKSLYNDQQIFPETRIKERFEQHEFRGRLLLGDANYSCTNYLFTPVTSTNQLTTKEESYNKAHDDTQAAVKKSPKLWRQRFRILQGEPLLCSSFSGAKHLIVALAVLHNIAIDLNDSCKEFTDNFGLDEFIVDSVYKDEANRENSVDKSGAEFRSAFISKYF